MKATPHTWKRRGTMAGWLMGLSIVLGSPALSPRVAWADDHARTLIWEPTPPEAHKLAIPDYLDGFTRLVQEAVQMAAPNNDRSDSPADRRSLTGTKRPQSERRHAHS